MKFIILSICLTLLLSCTSEKKVLNSWLGSSKKDLILRWGPPARTTSDGDSGEILIYSSTMHNPYMGGTFYQYRMFYVNKSGTIYHWMTQKGQVPPQQLDVNLFVR